MRSWPTVALAACVCLVVPAAHGSILIDDLEAGQHRKIVFMGTSLTAGVWPGLLGDWLTARYADEVTLINSGVPGSESSDGVRDVQTLVLDHHPDVLFIEYGMNDAWTVAEGYPEKISLEASAANLNFIIDALLAQNPGANVILQTTNASTSPNRPRLPLYYQVHRDVAAARGLELIDQYPVWAAMLDDDPATFAAYVPDGIHPSLAAWTEIGFPLIQAALLQGSFSRGDVDLDGFVNDDDLSLLLAGWRTGLNREQGNCDGVGRVDDDDLSLLLANWTGGAPGIAVPEPGTLALLLVALPVIVRRKRQ